MKIKNIDLKWWEKFAGTLNIWHEDKLWKVIRVIGRNYLDNEPFIILTIECLNNKSGRPIIKCIEPLYHDFCVDTIEARKLLMKKSKAKQTIQEVDRQLSEAIQCQLLDRLEKEFDIKHD